MEPVRIRPDVDPNSPEYKRAFRRVLFIVLFLMITGGSCLGYRIRQMEELGGGGRGPTSTAEADAGEKTDAAAGPGATSAAQKESK